MDNEYNQPGGYPPQYPAGQQSVGYPVQGYGTQQGYQQPADPYVVQQQGYQNAADGFGTSATYPGELNGYGAQQGYQQPADPYGTQQQSYQNAAEAFGTSATYPGELNAYGAAAQQPYQDPGAYQQPYSQDGYQHLFNQQPPMEEQPPAGFPPVPLKMRRRRLTGSDIALIVVALLAVIGFACWFLYSTYAPEVAKYGQIESGSLSATHAGDCLIVRNEAPYDAEGVTSITYDAQEGSLVKRGDKICKVYSAGYSSNAIRQLQEYREQIRDYQKDLMEEDGPFDGKMTGYNENVMTLVREMRSILDGASGSLANQETLLATAVKKRQDYMEQQYTSDQRYSRLYDDERSQTQRIDSWTKQHTATTEAIVSFYSDGYEYSLTSNNYMNFEPTEVRAMINGYKPELSATQKGKTTIYRMVRDGEWYVLFLSDYTEWNPVKGQVYELSLERFEDTQVLAEVVEFTRAGGELLLRLRVTGPVEDMLSMRTCEEVLGESMSTLMANKRAIYRQDGMTGVVVVEGSTESFIPVNVVLTDGDNVYFQPIQQGLLFEGMTVRLF